MSGEGGRGKRMGKSPGLLRPFLSTLTTDQSSGGTAHANDGKSVSS